MPLRPIITLILASSVLAAVSSAPSAAQVLVDGRPCVAEDVPPEVSELAMFIAKMPVVIRTYPCGEITSWASVC
jgi:hypothetical protein